MSKQTTTEPMRQVLAGQIGLASAFRLFVDGPYTAREIDLLIRSLEVTRDAMDDESAERNEGPTIDARNAKHSRQAPEETEPSGGIMS